MCWSGNLAMQSQVRFHTFQSSIGSNFKLKHTSRSTSINRRKKMWAELRVTNENAYINDWLCGCDLKTYKCANKMVLRGPLQRGISLRKAFVFIDFIMDFIDWIRIDLFFSIRVWIFEWNLPKVNNLPKQPSAINILFFIYYKDCDFQIFLER